MNPIHIRFIRNIASDIFTAISEGKADTLTVNPAITFTRYAKSGGYDSISDDVYNQLLADTEWASKTLWKDQPMASYRDLMGNLLAQCRWPGYTSMRAGYLASKAVDANPAITTYPDEVPDFGFTFIQEDKSSAPAKTESPAAPIDADLDPFSDEDVIPTKPEVVNWSPKEIYDYLSNHIFGQEEAKKAASMLLWNHVHDRKRNILFAGPTGCGKTAIWQTLQQLYPDIVIVDGSHITCDGWKGSFKAYDILDALQPADMEHAIVVIDEFDKLCEPKYSSHENVSASVQAELLKMIEGGTVERDRKPSINCSCISFVFLGSFEQMLKKKGDACTGSIGFGRDVHAAEAASYNEVFTPEDLVQYASVRREIAGRIDSIIQLHPMTAESYKQILRTPSMSPVSCIEKEYCITVTIPDSQASALCQKAADSHMGVRYLKSRIRNELDREMFAHPDRKEYLLFPEA